MYLAPAIQHAYRPDSQAGRVQQDVAEPGGVDREKEAWFCFSSVVLLLSTQAGEAEWFWSTVKEADQEQTTETEQ